MGNKEDNVDKQDKPRLAQVLGVEEDEEWTYPGLLGRYRVHGGIRQYKAGEGNWYNCSNETDLVEIINHAKSISRAPHLTDEEMERCRVFGARWIFVNPISQTVAMWTRTEKPYISIKDGDDGRAECTIDPLENVHVDLKFFPSLAQRLGDVIELKDENEACEVYAGRHGGWGCVKGEVI